MKTTVIAVLITVLTTTGFSLKSCRNEAHVRGVVVSIDKPEVAQYAGDCASNMWGLLISTESTQRDPTTGNLITVKSSNYVCVSENEAARYTKYDVYPRR